MMINRNSFSRRSHGNKLQNVKITARQRVAPSRRGRNKHRGGPLIACLSIAAMGLGGCGTPDGTPPIQQQEAGNGTNPATLSEVYEKLSGLDKEDRKEMLIELAKNEVSENGPLLWYTVTSQDDATKTGQQFSEATGVEASVYAASALDKRIEEEANAGSIKADIVRINQLEMTHGVEEGWFVEIDESPVFDELKEGAVHDVWVAEQIYAEVVTWNTDLVDTPPSSYTDVFSNYRDSNLGLSLKNADWLYAVTQILQEKEGHTEESAKQLLREAATGFVPVESSSLSAELLASGDYKVCATCLIYRNPRLIEEGAPIDFVPPVGPVPIKYSGLAIPKDTDHPAGALLFMEWMLTDGQQAYVDAGRTPINKNYQGGVDNYPEITDLYEIQYENGILDDLEAWEQFFQELVQSSGREPIG